MESILSLPIDNPGVHHFSGATNSDLDQYVYFEDQNGVVVDLTGASLAMAIKDKPGGTSWLSLTSAGLTANGSGLVMDTPAEGTFSIQIKRADLAAMPFGTKAALVGAYDIVVTDAQSVARRFLKGNFTVEKGITV